LPLFQNPAHFREVFAHQPRSPVRSAADDFQLLRVDEPLLTRDQIQNAITIRGDLRHACSRLFCAGSPTSPRAYGLRRAPT
jgi:hypothetical protein